MTKRFFGDTTVLLGRSLRHIMRSPDTIITTTIMPISFMLLFVYVFGGAIRSGSDKYVNYMLPGVLLMAIASGVSYTAFRLFLDMKSGIFERLQSLPIARSSVLWAHVLTSLVANLVSLVVVVLVALLMGFRPGAGVLAWALGRRHPDSVHPDTDLDRHHPRPVRKVRRRRERLLLPAHLPAIYQLGIRTHQHHARPGTRLRRTPAGDLHRQHRPQPAHTAIGQQRHLDRPRLVSWHPHHRLRLRHHHLPPQNRLTMRRAWSPMFRPSVSPCSIYGLTLAATTHHAANTHKSHLAGGERSRLARVADADTGPEGVKRADHRDSAVQGHQR